MTVLIKVSLCKEEGPPMAASHEGFEGRGGKVEGVLEVEWSHARKCALGAEAVKQSAHGVCPGSKGCDGKRDAQACELGPRLA